MGWGQGEGEVVFPYSALWFFVLFVGLCSTCVYNIIFRLIRII